MTRITSPIKTKIQQILSVVETGSILPNYSIIAIFRDGKNNTRQITYGKHQVTEQGNLRKLIELYVASANAKHGENFKPYISKIGTVPLVEDQVFITLLRTAGQDPVMQRAQDSFFDTQYWRPAENFFRQNGFTLPLSMLVIYDSYIHSGSILRVLRAQFDEVVPSVGGDEKKWVEAYLRARNQWLANHQNVILRRTVYRTSAMLNAIKEDNWMLDKNYAVNGHNVQ